MGGTIPRKIKECSIYVVRESQREITKEVGIGDGKVIAIVNESRAIETIMTYTF